MSNIIEKGIYTPRMENTPGGLAIVYEAKDGKVKFAVIEEDEINKPFSFEEHGAFTLPENQFLTFFEFTGMYEKPIN